jgi:hypothetical protein
MFCASAVMSHGVAQRGVAWRNMYKKRAQMSVFTLNLSIDSHQTWFVDAVYLDFVPNNIWRTCGHVAWRSMAQHGVKIIKKDQICMFFTTLASFAN